MRDARTMFLFCQSKPIAFLPFSLPSPSSLLKLPTDFGNITPGRHIFCNVTNFKETLERVYSHAELFMYRTQCINYNSVFCKQFDQNEHFSSFEFSSAGIKIGFSINSVGLNSLGRP